MTTGEEKEREQKARKAVQSALHKLGPLFTKEGNRKFFSAHMQTADVDQLVDLARDGDREALEILRKHARQWHLDAQNAKRPTVDVPNALLQLLLELFIYGPPPRKRGTGPKDTYLRDRAVAMLVKIVSQDYGFSEYQNPEHRGNPEAPMTASRLVAEEMRLSERRIEEIWGEHKASVMSPPRRSRPPN